MNKENNTTINLKNDLILSIYKLIERENLLAEYFDKEIDQIKTREEDTDINRVA